MTRPRHCLNPSKQGGVLRHVHFVLIGIRDRSCAGHVRWIKVEECLLLVLPLNDLQSVLAQHYDTFESLMYVGKTVNAIQSCRDLLIHSSPSPVLRKCGK